MSTHLADRIPSARLVGQGAQLRRYEMRTSKEADPRELDQLRRAFARTAAQCSPTVRAVDVFDDRGCLLVVMRILGSGRHAVREGERFFAVAWYDAFGHRSSTHVGRLSDVVYPAPLWAAEPRDAPRPLGAPFVTPTEETHRHAGH